MAESAGMRNAMHLARSGVFYGSIIEVSLSSMALIFIISFFKDIEKSIELADHAWIVMYSTVCTTTVMLVSGILGLATTWSREKVRRSAPMVKNAAFLKAAIEGFLFCYMVPFNIIVAYWICTTPGPSGWAKAIKVLLSAPGMFFQFGWFIACHQFWKVLYRGHGEDLVMPSEAVHSFANLSEPLLPEDSSDVDISARGVFKSASQFGPMGMPGPAGSESPTMVNGDEHINLETGTSVDGDHPNGGTNDIAAAGDADEAVFSLAAPGPSVSPVLSPSRLRRIDIDAADPNSPCASSTDISDDKENSARGPGDPIIAAATSSATAASASGEETVLSPSVHSQASLMRTPPKVPPLAIPFPSPGSPRGAANPSGQASSHLSTPSTVRPSGADVTHAHASVPPLPPLPAAVTRSPSAPPTSAHTPTPATPRSASARIAALLSARKLVSPMAAIKAGGGSAGASPGDAAGLPPPSPHSDLSLSRFMNLVKSRKHAAKAAQKLPQHFAGAAAQFAVKPSRAQGAAGPDSAGVATGSHSVPGSSVDSLPHLDGRGALSADATVFHYSGGRWEEVGGASSEEGEAAGAEGAPAGSGTTPRWQPGAGTLNTHDFDGSMSSEGDFEDATSEMAPSSTTSGGSVAHRAADKIFRRGSAGDGAAEKLFRRASIGDGAAAFGSTAIGSKVSNVWSKVKARTAAAGRGGE